MKTKIITILAIFTTIGLSVCSAFKTSLNNQPSTANVLPSIHKLDNINIKNQADKKVWGNFVKNCIVSDNISAGKLMTLASSGTSGISNFLSTFKAPASLMTNVYGKIKSCPDALPVVQKIVKSVNL